MASVPCSHVQKCPFGLTEPATCAPQGIVKAVRDEPATERPAYDPHIILETYHKFHSVSFVHSQTR